MAILICAQTPAVMKVTYHLQMLLLLVNSILPSKWDIASSEIVVPVIIKVIILTHNKKAFQFES